MVNTVYLDRLITESTPGVSATFAGGATTWTLPYSIAGDGSEGVINVVDGTSGATLVCTQPALNQVSVAGVNLVGSPVFIGLQYQTSYTFSLVFIRAEGGDGKPDQRGRLNLRYVMISYEDTTDFTVTVSAVGKADRNYVYKSTTLASGKFIVPVLEHNTNVAVTISCTNGGSFGWSGYEWEGTLFTRARLL